MNSTIPPPREPITDQGQTVRWTWWRFFSHTENVGNAATQAAQQAQAAANTAVAAASQAQQTLLLPPDDPVDTDDAVRRSLMLQVF